MRYTGELYFADDDIINVQPLIIRSDSELAFLFIANWGGQGKWRKSGIASFDGKNYVSNTEPATQVETAEKGSPCTVIFSRIEKDEGFLRYRANNNLPGCARSPQKNRGQIPS